MRVSRSAINILIKTVLVGAVGWMGWYLRDYLYPMSAVTILKIVAYGAIPLVLAWAGDHFAADVVKEERKKRIYRGLFVFFAVSGIVLIAVVEKQVEDDHKKEVKEQKQLSDHLSSQVDRLVDIQSRMSSASPLPNGGDISAFRQQIRDDQERTRIALDSIERKLAQVGKNAKDDLRTRTLQLSKNLLAFLYQHSCDRDALLDKTIYRNQVFLQCLERMRTEYMESYQKPTLQIIDELQSKGIDVSGLRPLAETGWNNKTIERIAIELSKYSERLPKKD